MKSTGVCECEMLQSDAPVCFILKGDRVPEEGDPALCTSWSRGVAPERGVGTTSRAGTDLTQNEVTLFLPLNIRAIRTS